MDFLADSTSKVVSEFFDVLAEKKAEAFSKFNIE
jgi:hypothetical protein